MSIKAAIKTYFVIFILAVMHAKPAYAYLDLGTGSYLLQMLLAAIFSTLFFLKSQIKYILSICRDTIIKFTKGAQELKDSDSNEQ